MEILLQQIINGLVLGSMYALVALGYTMVYGIINLINFAHGEVLMVGAMTSWTIIGLMKDATPGAPGWVVLIVAMITYGFQHQCMALINLALAFFVATLIARYTDIFWRLLPRSLFFIVGGLLLIAGGVFLERKRRIVLDNLRDLEVRDAD